MPWVSEDTMVVGIAMSRGRRMNIMIRPLLFVLFSPYVSTHDMYRQWQGKQSGSIWNCGTGRFYRIVHVEWLCSQDSAGSGHC